MRGKSPRVAAKKNKADEVEIFVSEKDQELIAVR
jgi:hypothetical protein